MGDIKRKDEEAEAGVGVCGRVDGGVDGREGLRNGELHVVLAGAEPDLGVFVRVCVCRVRMREAASAG